MKAPTFSFQEKVPLASTPHLALQRGDLGLQVPRKGPRDGPGVALDTLW